MIEFVANNIVVILLVIGAVVPFVLSLYEKISEKKKVRVMLILLSTGFIITFCVIVISDIQQKNSAKVTAELESKKKEMIENITKNVSVNLKTSIEALNVSRQSLTLLESLESNLKGTTIKEAAVELIASDYDNLHVFEKGDPSRIPQYVGWLEATLRQPGKEPAIAITVNANRSYVVGLILAYLLANEDNQNAIMTSLRPGWRAWKQFPDDTMLRSMGGIHPKVKYVLFYDGDKNRLLGFADASMFARELLLYQYQGLAESIGPILNEPGRASGEIMKNTFSSFHSAVFSADSAYEAARELIERKANSGVSVYQGKPWFISLSKVIKLAT
jgi:hypothetical protein